jgi:hypothetical protein
MRCHHCAEELDSQWKYDSTASCPACHQPLGSTPIDFQAVATPIEMAGDLAAVEKIVQVLRHKTPELFLVPHIPKVTPESKQPNNTTPVPSAIPTQATAPASFPAAVLSLIMQPQSNTATYKPATALFAWLALGVGLMLFTCGGAMLLWSLFRERPDLINISFPLMLAGQGVLIFGLISLMETYSKQSRMFEQQLQDQADRWELLQQWALMQGNQKFDLQDINFLAQTQKQRQSQSRAA